MSNDPVPVTGVSRPPPSAATAPAATELVLARGAVGVERVAHRGPALEALLVAGRPVSDAVEDGEHARRLRRRAILVRQVGPPDDRRHPAEPAIPQLVLL